MGRRHSLDTRAKISAARREQERKKRVEASLAKYDALLASGNAGRRGPGYGIVHTAALHGEAVAGPPARTFRGAFNAPISPAEARITSFVLFVLLGFLWFDWLWRRLS